MAILNPRKKREVGDGLPKSITAGQKVKDVAGGVKPQSPLAPQSSSGGFWGGASKQVGAPSTGAVSPTPQPKPSVPPIAGAVRDVHNLAQQGASKETVDGLFAALEADISTPGSAYYNAYWNPTSKAARELASLGYVLPDVPDDQWRADAGAYIANYQRNTATGTTAAAPTKKSSAEQNTAYWLSRYLEDLDRTQAAKNESLALDRELSYWVGRGYSDDAAIAKIDMSNYPTLAKMRDAQAGGEPLQLTEALPFSDDWLYTKAWAARNPDIASGDYVLDLMTSGMGTGNAYKPDPASEAARDPSNLEAYHPYNSGATSDALRMKYGLDSWTLADLEANRAMLNDPEQADDWRKMYAAAENTQAAQQELEGLKKRIQNKIDGGKTLDQIFNASFEDMLKEDYPTLWKMEDYRKKGSSMELSDSVDFSMPYFREWVVGQIGEAEVARAKQPTEQPEVTEAPTADAARPDLGPLRAEMEQRQRSGIPVTADIIGVDALEAISANIGREISAEEAAEYLNAAIASGRTQDIDKALHGVMAEPRADASQKTEPRKAAPGELRAEANAPHPADSVVERLEGLVQRAQSGGYISFRDVPRTALQVFSTVTGYAMDEDDVAARFNALMERGERDEAARYIGDVVESMRVALGYAPTEKPEEAPAPEALAVRGELETLLSQIGDAMAIGFGSKLDAALLTDSVVAEINAANGTERSAQDILAELNLAIAYGDGAAAHKLLEGALEANRPVEEVPQEAEEALQEPEPPVEPWDWDSYNTRRSTMSETDFGRYEVDVANGILQFLRGETVENADARSFLESYGDLLGGPWIAEDDYKFKIDDVRRRYGETIAAAMDAVNKSHVDGYAYARAIMETAAAYEDALQAEPYAEVADAMERDAHTQRLIDDGTMSPMDAMNAIFTEQSELDAMQADAYFAEHPDALGAIAGIAEQSQAAALAAKAEREAEAQARVQAAQDAYEEQVAEYVPLALEAFGAVSGGTATEEQAALVKNALATVTDGARGGDETYSDMFVQMRNITNDSAPQLIVDQNIGLSTLLLAQHTLDEHLGLAKSAGLTLGELYERYPELYIAPAQLVADARESFATEWTEFGRGVDALYDAAEAVKDADDARWEEIYANSGGNKAPGIGFFPAAGMGVKTGWEQHKLGWGEVYDTLALMGLSELDIEFSNRTGSYGERSIERANREKKIAGVQNPEYKAELEAEMAGLIDVFATKDPTWAIPLRDNMLTQQKRIAEAQQFVLENGTPLEVTTFNATSSLTNTGLTMAEYMALNLATGGTSSGVMAAINGALTFGSTEGAQLAQRVYAETGDRRAALLSGSALALVVGTLNSQQMLNINIPGIGTGADSFVQAGVKRGFQSLMVQNPGAAGRAANALLRIAGGTLGLAASGGTEESIERVATEITTSMLMYANTGVWKEPDYTGILSEDFAMGALAEVVFGGVGAATSKASDIITGRSAEVKLTQEQVTQNALDYTAARNVSADIANGALEPVLQGPLADDVRAAKVEVGQASAEIANLTAAVAEQSRLQQEAEADFTAKPNDDSLNAWMNATEALESAQAKLEGAQTRVETAQAGVEAAQGALNDAVLQRMAEIRDAAAKNATEALSQPNVRDALKALDPADLSKAKARLDVMQPGTPEHAAISALVAAIEKGQAVEAFKADNAAALADPDSRSGKKAQAALDILTAERDAAVMQIGRMSETEAIARSTLDAAMKNYAAANSQSENIAKQGVKQAVLGVDLANALQAYAKTQQALRNAGPDADVAALVNADDAAKAALDNARAMYESGKQAMQSVVRDAAIETLAESENEVAQDLADAVASNDRARVEEILSDVVDSAAEPLDADAAETESSRQTVPQMADALMSGDESASDIAFMLSRPRRVTDSNPSFQPRIGSVAMPGNNIVQSDAPSGRITNPVQIIRSLLKSLGVGDYVGSGNMNAGADTTVPKGVLGYYAKFADYVVTGKQNAADFATTLHEVGHALSAKLGMMATDAMRDALPEAFRKAYAADALHGEAFAEFVANYMINGRDSAIQRAGADFVTEFEAKAREAGLFETVREHAAAVQEFLAATVDAKIKSMMRTTPEARASQGGTNPIRKLIGSMVDDSVYAVGLDKAANATPETSIRNAILFADFRMRAAENSLTDVMADARGNVIGESFSEIFSRNNIQQSDMDGLWAYMIAKHSIDLETRAENAVQVLPSSATLDARRELVASVEADSKHIVKAAQEVNGWWNKFMQAWLVDTGLLSQAEFDRMREVNPNYIPLQRVRVAGINGTDSGGGYQLRFIRGGDTEIVNPIESYVRYAQGIGRLVAQNEVANALHNLYQNTPDLGEFMRDVTPPSRSTQTIDPNADAVVENLLIEGIRRPQVNEHDRIISGVTDGGTRFSYEITDPDLFRALSVSPRAMSTGLELLGRVTRGMSSLITSKNPLFTLRNAMRDYKTSVNWGSWSASYYSPLGIGKWFASLIAAYRETDAFKEYQAQGGGGYSMLRADNRASLRQMQSAIVEQDALPRKIGNKAISWITLERMNEAIEQASRYAEYRYGKHDLSTPEGRKLATLAAQDATVDFTRSGDSQAIRALRQVTPFLNPTLQGAYRTARMFTEAERGRLPARLAKVVFNNVMRAALQLGALSLLGDEDDLREWSQLSDPVKAGNFIIPVQEEGGGGFWGIRLPTEQDMPSQAMYIAALNGISMLSDDMSISAMEASSAILENALPSSSLFSPLWNAAMNRTYYGSAIVPQSMSSLPAVDQYDDNTPGAFVGLARMLYTASNGGISISPEKLQYVTEQYSGVLGKIGIPLLSPGLDGQYSAGNSLNNVLFSTAKQYTIDPAYTNDLSNAFYGYRDTFNKIKAAAKSDGIGTKLRPGLSEEDAKQAYTEADNLTKAGGTFKVTADQIAELYREMDELNARTDLSYWQKTRMKRGMREEVNKLMLGAIAEGDRYAEKYLATGGIGTLIDRFTKGNAIAQAPTKLELMPDTFKADVDSAEPYIVRAAELIDANPTLNTVYPNPARTFKDKGEDYSVPDALWGDYTAEYRDTYLYALDGMTEREWAGMDNDERVETYQKAHDKASRAAKKWYLRNYT